MNFCYSRITGVDGFVRVDGRIRDLDEFRRMSCYIQQDDRLQPLLTTWENMEIAADLKLGVDVSSADKKKRVSTLNMIKQARVASSNTSHFSPEALLVKVLKNLDWFWAISLLYLIKKSCRNSEIQFDIGAFIRELTRKLAGNLKCLFLHLSYNSLKRERMKLC